MSDIKQRRITRRELVIDNYHGTLVADPYRWLEDDTSPEVKEWCEAQNGDFRAYIDSYDVREEFKQRYTGIWRYAKSDAPYWSDGYYYTWRNDGLQNQHVLYRSSNLKDAGEVVLDPNTFSEDGTVAVLMRSFSPKGGYMAYTTSSSGSDWQVIKVLNLKTLNHLPDQLHHVKFGSIAWLPDDSGMFYTRYPDPKASTVLSASARNSMICLHMLGAEQEKDRLIHNNPEQPDWDFRVYSDAENRYLFLHTGFGSTLRKNKLHYRPMEDLDAPWRVIADDFDECYEIIGVTCDTAYVFTQRNAPFGRVMSVKLSANGAGDWREVIPDQGEMLDFVRLFKDKLLCGFVHHASNRLKVYTLEGALERELELPALGSVAFVTGKQDRAEFFVHFASYLHPDTILRFDILTGERATVFQADVSFPFGEYETVQEFYKSKDGTTVPMFITRRKGVKKDGSNPAVLYGYGGFNIAMKPVFSVSILPWLEKGGIYAVACMRGGDEYGEAWHRAGMLESKQNVFDDFIAAAEHLINEGYTVNKRLGIIGRSNGGLLTGACVTQRPDLYGAVIVGVPVLDMLRYHRFTAGRYWTGEYGCSENPEQFEFLYKYSPLHNIRMNAVYPPTLVMTADTDDRVVPMQARKFAATIQAADGGENPIFIRIEKAAGHGHGKPVYKLIDEQVDTFTFFTVNLCKND